MTAELKGMWNAKTWRLINAKRSCHVSNDVTHRITYTCSDWWYYSLGFWITIKRYSLSEIKKNIYNDFQFKKSTCKKSIWWWRWRYFLPGATMISCFLDLILRNVKSFWGSISRTVLLAFMVNWWRRPAYCTVVELSRVVLIGIPSKWGKKANCCYNHAMLIQYITNPTGF